MVRVEFPIPRRIRLLAWLFRRWLERFELPADSAARIRAAAERGRVVFLMRSAGWVELLVWAQVLTAAGLPAPTALFGLGRTRRGANHDAVPSHALVVLGDRPADGPDPLEVLCREHRQKESETSLFPVALLWNTRPRSMERSLWEIAFGPRERAGALRKLGWLVLGSGQDTVRVAERIALHDFVREYANDELAVLARRVRLAVRVHLAGEERSVLGPRLPPRRRLLDRALKDRALQGVIADAARMTSQDTRAIEKRAAAMLDEIAADFRFGYIRFLEFMLSKFWSRMYEDFQIDLDGLERVREASRRGPVLLIPSHKSHMDYLILSYFFKINGLVPPHIAAGDNLSFFPLGQIFRRCGAFFIRRSFIGDTLYETALKAYIKTLLKESFNIEFFIEGTRSRSGKIMPPKLGMLSMIIEAERELNQPVHVVPVSIDYEALVEEAAMVREARGGEKQSEGVGGLLRASSTLQNKYGSVYLRFHEPLALRELMDRHGGNLLQQARGVAYDILHGIQRSVTVTATALVATAIVVHHKRGIRRPLMLDRIARLERLARRQGAHLASDFLYGTLDPDRAIRLLLRNRVLRLIEIQGETVYSVDDGNRMALDYYKNNIIHFLVNTSFACLAFRVRRADTFESLWEGYRGLHEIFVEEFHRIGRPPTPGELLAELEWLTAEGMTERDGDAWRVVNAEEVMAFENVTRNFLESAYIAVMTLLESQPVPRELRDWLRLTMDMGELLYARGDIWRSESRNKINLQNAFTSFRHAGFLGEVETDGRSRRRGKPAYRVTDEGRVRLVEIRDLLNRILVEVQF